MPSRAELTGSGKGGRPVVLALLLALLVSVPVLVAVNIAPPAGAAVARGKVGPKVQKTGFPFYYADTKGRKLGLCLAGPPLCLEGLPHPNQRALVANKASNSNFPDEAFWWAGEASIERLPNGRPREGRAQLVLAREAAFANEVPRSGDQVAFSRVRIRVDNLVPRARYIVIHPYGRRSFVAQNGGQDVGGFINFTSDIGCAVGPLTRCNFREALFGKVDPFLIWHPDVAPAPPNGYVGNPNVPHRVTGSPNKTNYFRIHGPNAGGRGTGVNVIGTKLFSIQGKLAGRAPTVLSLDANPSKIRLGRTVALSGRLSSFGRPLADRTVTLLRKPRGATRFVAVDGGRRTTNAKGFFSLRGVRPRATTVYRATYAGQQRSTDDARTGLKASSSGPKTVTVVRP